MKKINTHHFPLNPFEEQQQQQAIPYRPYQFYSTYHRRHSMAYSHYGTGGSIYGSLHPGHPHHALLSSIANRTMKTNFDLARLSRVREQLNVTLSAAAETDENRTSSSGEHTPPSPSSHQPTGRNVPASHGSVSTSNDDDRLLNQFLREYLGRDGILIVYILQVNTNEVITGEIVTALFDLFKTTI